MPGLGFAGSRFVGADAEHHEKVPGNRPANKKENEQEGIVFAVAFSFPSIPAA